MKNEPIRHHFIPQFILRNFSKDGITVHYYNKNHGKTSTIAIRDLFMERNLYRFEEELPDTPTQIESDLARYEGQIANILKHKILSMQDVVLSPEEVDAVKLFLAIMGFRSAYTEQIVNDNIFVKNSWKHNLRYLVNCRSIDEVFVNDDIDDAIKIFMRRDTEGIFGRYMVIVESPDEEGFVLGDAYPVAITGMLYNGVPVPMYDIFPISPRRAILLACKGLDGAPRDVAQMRELIFRPPSSTPDGMTKIRVKRLHPEELNHLNTYIKQEAKTGYITI